MSVPFSRFDANEPTPNPYANDIIKLERKVSRAAAAERGIQLSATELTILTVIGAVRLLSEARVQVLEENAKCRSREVSIKEAFSTSITHEAKAACHPAPGSTSSGMTARQEGSNARARALQMLS